MAHELRVDVYFDLICPWCLIGKRHLNLALEQLNQAAPDIDVTVQWNSVRLIPDTPAEGLDFAEFYLRRLGSPEAVRMRQGQVRDAAARAGTQVDFARIKRFPNTAKAHQMFAFAAQHLPANQLEALLERLFAAYFNLGEDLGAMDTLLAIAAEWRLDLPTLQAWIETGHGLPKPLTMPGVPFFVFNRTHALSGAQPPETLLAAMRQSISATPAIPA
jgi:predicted DsbA family dithiol-disulfide isomerase